MTTFNKKDYENKFKSFRSYSKNDAQKLLSNRSKIEEIAHNGTLSEYINDIKTYFQMLGDFFSGKYKKVPVGTIAAIVGTLLYVLAPVDLIPDFIPGIGFIDDAAILGLCINFARYDVDEYKKNKTKLIDK